MSPPEGQNIVTTTRSHSNRTVVDAVEACDPSEILRAGGAGHKVKPVGAAQKDPFTLQKSERENEKNNNQFIEMLLSFSVPDY